MDNLKRMDSLSKSERSLQMSRVRSKGNRSTEVRLRMELVRSGIKGWELHPRNVVGAPDFWFAAKGVAVFVDGCFWHGCKTCLRMPKGNRTYWEAKIARNIARDSEVTSALSRNGISVIRIWEHEVRPKMNLKKAVLRIERALAHASKA
jgi:DNA mismatch endonuclease (patch repair protein)